MDVFLSWSGEKSQAIAELLKKWIPSVLQAVKPFLSSNDIEKGKRWSTEIAEKLESINFGLLIITADNHNAPWILFEAGALSKNIGSGHVSALLIDIKPTDLIGPLSQFQNTNFIKKDVFRLVSDMNVLLGESKIDKEILENTFNKMWDDLNDEVKGILDNKPSTLIESRGDGSRTDREIIEEVLRHVREMQYKHLWNKDSHELAGRIKDQESHVYFEDLLESIVFKSGGHENYSIPIEQLSNTAEILDFLFQVNGKSWATKTHIKGFIDTLEELSREYFQKNAQAIMCIGGTYMSIDWQNKKSISHKVIKKGEI